MLLVGGAALAWMGITIYAQPAPVDPWPMAGHDLANSRSQPLETHIDAHNVSSLTTKWVFQTGGDISTTPAVGSDAVFVPDWAGNLYAINKDTGQRIWSTQISQYDGITEAFSRVTPALHGPDLIIGDTAATVHDGARVMAINRKNGRLHWITQVEKNQAAVITGSPVVSGDVVVVGVSSIEEGLANTSGYVCCTFRGSLVALDANTGKVLWQTYTVPDNGGQPTGYSGGAIWQPPAIDTMAGIVYVGTGNNYKVPASVVTCQDKASLGTASCTDSNDHFDAAMAVNLNTGAVMWSKSLQAYDAWTVACLVIKPDTTSNCPQPYGPDYDFSGSGPNLLPGFVGWGQKSGVFWGLDPSSGNIKFGTAVGPGSTIGGIEWGTATDGKQIYAAIGNNLHDAYKLAGDGPAITWGSWAALDVKTGAFAWQVPDPTQGAIDTGAVSVANGVVYAGSYSGNMYALDAKTGKVLWSFATAGSVIDGPSIADGVVYWGSGYKNIAPGKPNNQLFAFTVR